MSRSLISFREYRYILRSAKIRPIIYVIRRSGKFEAEFAITSINIFWDITLQLFLMFLEGISFFVLSFCSISDSHRIMRTGTRARARDESRSYLVYDVRILSNYGTVNAHITAVHSTGAFIAAGFHDDITACNDNDHV